jgi:hypothetical protein
MCCVVGFECWEIVCEVENSMSGLCQLVGFCVFGVECTEIVGVGIVCQSYVRW